MIVNLSNVGYDRVHGTIVHKDEVVDIKGFEGSNVKGIKYFRHKPNRFMRFFRKTIEATVNEEGDKVYLKRSDAIQYVRNHGGTKKEKFKKGELEDRLEAIFNKSINKTGTQN